MKEENFIWNFSFGSNMSSKILQQRRKIKPLEIVPARVRNWRISFFPMVPYFEPGMGTIERHKGSICHGVLLKLRRDDFNELYESEGGEPGAYRLSSIEAETYDGTVINAIVFETKIKLKTAGYPSSRYMNLLIEGAVENELDEKYIKELKSIPTNPTTIYQKVLVLPIFGPFMVILFGYMFVCDFLRNSCGLKMIPFYYFHLFFDFFWFLHDYCLKYIFGDGGKWESGDQHKTNSSNLNKNFLSIINFESNNVLKSLLKILKCKKIISIEEVKPEEYENSKFISLLNRLQFDMNESETKVIPPKKIRKYTKISSNEKKRKLENEKIEVFNEDESSDDSSDSDISITEKLKKEISFRVKIHKLVSVVYSDDIQFTKDNFTTFTTDHYKLVKIDNLKMSIYLGNLTRSNGNEYAIVFGYFSENPVLIDIKRCDFSVKENDMKNDSFLFSLNKFSKVLKIEIMSELNNFYENDRDLIYFRMLPKNSKLTKFEVGKLSYFLKKFESEKLNIGIISILFSFIFNRNPKNIQKFLINERIKKFNSVEEIDCLIKDIETELSNSSNLMNFNEFNKFYREKKIKKNDSTFYEIDDISQGKSFHPIKLKNEKNFENYQSNIYVNENICGEGVDSNVLFDKNFITGCNCSQEFGLSCYQLESCECSKENETPPYIDDKLINYMVLKIYECNSKCECDFNCPMRLVQKGMNDSFQFEVYFKDKIGWSVKSLQDIPQGTFIGEYKGEIISEKIAETRGIIYDEVGCSFLFDMLEFENYTNEFSIDSTDYGNFTKYFNHSCDPNLIAKNIYIDNRDDKFSRIAFFALKDIKKGDPLEFNYNYKIKDYIDCFCGSLKCKKYFR
eukprot:gene3606-6340_t